MNSEFLLSNIINSIDCGIVVLNEGLQIVKVNETFENLLGYKENELLDKNISFLLPKKCEETGIKEETIAIEKKDKIHVYVSISTKRISLDNKSFQILTFVDRSGEIKYKNKFRELSEHEKEVRGVIFQIGILVNRVVKGNLSQRMNVSTIPTSMRTIAENFNIMLERLQTNTILLEKRREVLANAMLIFGEVLNKVAAGDLSVSVDLDKISKEYHPIGENINKMIKMTKKREEELLKIADEIVVVMESIGSGNYEYRIDTSFYEIDNIKLVAETMNAVMEYLKKSS